MKQWTLSIILAAATAVVVSAQTTSTYRGMTVRVPAPTGAAGLAWQNNFKSLADRIGNHIEAVTDPTANDDEANTAGHGAVMDRSTWRNTSDNGFFVCVDASEGAAVWIELGESVDLSAPGPIGDVTASSGAFTAISCSGPITTTTNWQGLTTAYGGSVTTGTAGHIQIGLGGALKMHFGGAQRNVVWCPGFGRFAIGENAELFYDRESADFTLETSLHLAADNQSLTLGAGDDFDISYDDSKGVIDCAGGVYVAQGPLDVAGVIAWRNTSGNYIGFFTQASSGGRVLLSNSAGATVIDMKAAGPSYMHTSLGINESAPDYALDVNGSFGFTPGSSVTPADNGDLVIEATSNTSLTFRYKGSDGTVRSASLTLSP